MIPSLSSHDVMYNVIDSVRKLTMQIIVEAYRSYALLAGGGVSEGTFTKHHPLDGITYTIQEQSNHKDIILCNTIYVNGML
jgi:hypothetical protein